MSAWDKAKEKLFEEITAGRIPRTLRPKQVYELDPLYQKVNYENFRTNLNELRKRIDKHHQDAKLDNDALINDRMIHLVITEGRWPGSLAEELLKKDVDDEKHKSMTPKDLYNSRDEYQTFNYQVFRKHIHQEVRCRVETTYWMVVKAQHKQEKAEKRARKEARKEAKQKE